MIHFWKREKSTRLGNIGYFCSFRPVRSGHGSRSMKQTHRQTRLCRTQGASALCILSDLSITWEALLEKDKRKKVNQELKCIQQLEKFWQILCQFVSCASKICFFNSFMKHSYLKPLGQGPSFQKKGFWNTSQGDWGKSLFNSSL